MSTALTIAAVAGVLWLFMFCVFVVASGFNRKDLGMAAICASAALGGAALGSVLGLGIVSILEVLT